MSVVPVIESHPQGAIDVAVTRSRGVAGAITRASQADGVDERVAKHVVTVSSAPLGARPGGRTSWRRTR